MHDMPKSEVARAVSVGVVVVDVGMLLGAAMPVVVLVGSCAVAACRRVK